jgi:glycosyltransferase involved in cell wall biosynthesis
MRIGIDISCWPNRRGFGRFTRELVAALLAKPDGYEYVLLADRQTAERDDLPEGVEVAVADTAVAVSTAASVTGSRSIGDILAMRRMTARQSLDLIYFPAVYSYYPVAGRAPCLVTFHDTIAESLPGEVFPTRRGRLFWNLKSSLAMRRATAIVTVSHASARALAERFRISPSRIGVITEGPAEPYRRRTEPVNPRALQKHELELGQRFFIYVGGISPHKNLGTLFRAFAQLLGVDAYTDVWLAAVGDYGGDVFHTCYQPLKDLTGELNIRQRVRFTGYVPDDDLVHLLIAAQALVLPSFLEGFGLPAVEAMACGCPVLASDRGSLPEVVGDAGLLFDPRDAGAICQAMKRVLDDGELRSQLSERGLRQSEQFTWQRAAELLRDLFERFGRRPRATIRSATRTSRRWTSLCDSVS